MDPIASTGAQAFRPLTGGSDASVLLRDGRVLSAEVLTRSDGHSVVLAIGRHVIPAETELELDPGARFLVEVEEGANGVLLKLLGPAAEEESALLRALRVRVGENRPIGALLSNLQGELCARPDPESWPEPLRELFQELAAHVARPGAGAQALRTLLLGSGLGHEALLAALLAGGSARELLGNLKSDLKSLLLRALLALNSDSRPGELRETLARALGGIEAEQLLNLARERAGEPLVLSFPFPDGEGWSTARLAVPPRSSREQGRPSSDEQPPFRVALGLELSGLGPVRADFTLGPHTLAVRVLVTRPDVAARIQEALAELHERLGDGRRSVQVQVRVGTRAEAESGLGSDIRYLREHHLMNVAG